MKKFTEETKKRFIELMLSKQYSREQASKLSGISKSQGERWWKRYQYEKEHGKVKTNNPKDELFRLDAVQYMLEHDISILDGSMVLGVSESNLSKWLRLYRQEGERGLIGLEKGRVDALSKRKKNFQELDTKQQQAIQEENEYLKAEVAYLKKLIALKEAEQTKASKRQG